MWVKLKTISIFLGLVLLPGCARVDEQTAPPPHVQVVVATPIKKQIVEWDEYVGRLDAVDLVEIRARVSGYLQSIHFEEGQVVNKGDLLCVIDPRPFVADLDRAKAQHEEAKANLTFSKAQLEVAKAEVVSADASLDYARRRVDRSRTLVAGNTISQEELELRQSEFLQAQAVVVGRKAQVESSQAAIATATAAVATAESAVGIAELNLDYTRVIAPIAGRVSQRDVTEGNLISGGTLQSTLLTTIVSLDPIHCYFDADEQSFLKYTRLAMEGKRQSSREVKNPVYIALADEPKGFPHKGHMDFVDNRMDPNTGTLRARAIFANPDHTLTPGLFARLRLPGSGKYEAVLVPDSAVGHDQSEKFVLVVDGENKVQRQVVEIGPISSGLRVVRKGLDGTERIVLRGLQRVRPGIEVKPTAEILELKSDDGLPNDYQPVPKEEWISIRRKSDADVQPSSRGGVEATTNNSSQPPSTTPSSRGRNSP
jgi:RND family efflux transporter MFP subunit